MTKTIKEIDELILDLLFQACGKFKSNNKDNIPYIDNMCISTYQEACDYLTEKGYLKTLNGRIYNFNKSNKVKTTFKTT